MPEPYDTSPSNQPAAGGLAVAFEREARRDAILRAADVLAVVDYADETRSHAEAPHRITLGLPPVDGDGTIEVWRTETPVTRATDGPFGIAEAADVLFAQLVLDEAGYTDLDAATAHAYREICALLERRGFPHLVRIWNYFPDINAPEHELERYQAFCLGRHRALEPTPQMERDLPAATAIGGQGRGLVIYFLAARSPGLQIENPRQVSAFRYPERYSPRSPSFSRATLKHWGRERHLYISGTASIVGHESRHVDEPLAQLDEILENLQALIDSANRIEPIGIDTPSGLSLLKVYLREAGLLEPVRRGLEQTLGDGPRVIYLLGDICRRELALEIEALYTTRI
jgi:chorismate lyase/3-hydroxybenzoate synthase